MIIDSPRIDKYQRNIWFSWYINAFSCEKEAQLIVLNVCVTSLKYIKKKTVLADNIN